MARINQKKQRTNVSNKHILVTFFFEWRDGHFQENKPKRERFSVSSIFLSQFVHKKTLKEKTSQATKDF